MDVVPLYPTRATMPVRAPEMPVIPRLSVAGVLAQLLIDIQHLTFIRLDGHIPIDSH
jgi:hypothetical protein